MHDIFVVVPIFQFKRDKVHGYGLLRFIYVNQVICNAIYIILNNNLELLCTAGSIATAAGSSHCWE